MVVGQGPHKQKTLSVTQNKNYGPIRRMVVGECSRSTGVLLYFNFHCSPMRNMMSMVGLAMYHIISVSRLALGLKFV